LIEEIKQREAEASKQNRFLNMKVDPMCELTKVSVMDDYSCYMQQDDISYNDKGEHTKFFKMQLLVRDDSKKWFVWIQTGKVGSEATAPTRVSEFFNRYEAMVDFEKQFQKKSGGDKWKDKDWLAVGASRNAKPGMFKLINREQDKELLKTLTQQQNLVLSIIKESSEKN
jgi:WGR domain